MNNNSIKNNAAKVDNVSKLQIINTKLETKKQTLKNDDDIKKLKDKLKELKEENNKLKKRKNNVKIQVEEKDKEIKKINKLNENLQTILIKRYQEQKGKYIKYKDSYTIFKHKSLLLLNFVKI